jgi:putative FmdB family regulatory protein
MPIYEFRCKKCNEHIEVLQRLSDKLPSKCRKCGGRLEKLMSAPAIQFKGQGWYITDYARKGSKSERDSKSEKDSKAEKDSSTPGSAETGEKAKPKETPPKKSGSDGA